MSAQELIDYLSSADGIASDAKSQAYADMDFSGFYTASLSTDGTNWFFTPFNLDAHDLVAATFDDAISEADVYVIENGGARVTSYKTGGLGFQALFSDGDIPASENPSYNAFKSMFNIISADPNLYNGTAEFVEAGITKDGLDHWVSSFLSDGGYPTHDLIADVSDETAAKGEAQEYWESLGHRVICGWTDGYVTGYGKLTWILI